VNNVTPDWLPKFIDVYQQLGVDNVDDINDIYHSNVIFEDPLHRVEGLPLLLDYFQGLYTNLSSCSFVITNYFSGDEQASIYWRMTFTHSKLNGGKPVSVEGHSHLKGLDGKVVYHRDYLDVGAMLYEHIPVLGRAVKFMKKRASQ